MNPFNDSSLCELADWFPAEVGHQLEAGRREGHQWRETSWTDRFLLEVLKLRDPRIVVKNSNEAVTAADMDWWFVARDGSRHLCLTVQAKILHYRSPNDAFWNYGELRHPTGAHGRQSRQLVRHAKKETKAGRATYPLYLFYNPSGLPRPWPFYFRSPGITLTDGYWTAAHLESERHGSSIPISATRYSELRGQMFGLPMIFCRSRDVPGPDDVADAINTINDAIWAEKNARKRPRSRPTPGNGTPDHIWALVQRMKHHDSGTADEIDPDKSAPFARNTVVFLASD